MYVAEEYELHKFAGVREQILFSTLTGPDPVSGEQIDRKIKSDFCE